MHTYCPACQTRVPVDPEFLGLRIRCEHCRALFHGYAGTDSESLSAQPQSLDAPPGGPLPAIPSAAASGPLRRWPQPGIDGMLRIDGGSYEPLGESLSVAGLTATGVTFPAGLLARGVTLTVAGSATFQRCAFGGPAAFMPAVQAAAVIGDDCRFDAAVEAEGWRPAGPVTWTDTTFASNANFHEAQTGRIDFSRSRFAAGANFTGAVFGGIARFNGVAFDGEALFVDADFRSEGNFTGTSFARGADFSEARFEGGFELQRAHVGRTSPEDLFDAGRIAVNGWADFAGARFVCGASFVGARFASGAELADAIFESSAAFQDTMWVGDLSLRAADFGMDADFDRGRFHARADLREAVFRGRTDFSEARFEGPLVIDRTQFLGSADFSRSFVQVPLTIARCRFGESVTFAESRLMAGFALTGTRIVRSLDFTKADLRGAVELAGLHTGGTLILASSVWGNAPHVIRDIEAAGPVEAAGWTVGGPLTVERAWFSGDAGFESARFSAGAEWRGCVFDRRLELTRASVTGPLRWVATRFADPLDLRHAAINGPLRLEELETRGVRISRKQVEGKLESEQKRQFAVSMEEYGLLKRSFERENLYDDMDWAYLRFKQTEHRSEAPARFSPLRSMARGIKWWFFDVGAGYGTKPLRISVSCLTIVVLFALVYRAVDWQFQSQIQMSIEKSQIPDWVPMDGRTGEERPAFTLPLAFYFSSVTFLAMGSDAIYPNVVGGLKYVALVESALGIFALALFVATYTRKIIR